MPDELQDQIDNEVDEGLTLKGDLQGSSLPELVKSLTQGRETGILTLSSDGVDKSIHLKDGKILFAASTDPDERLGESLLSSGKISLEQYLESEQHIRPGRRQGSVLVELGYLSPDDLVRGVRDQVTSIVHSLFQWIRGEYKMVLKELNTHDLITLNLSTPGLIFEGIRGIRQWSRIYRGLGSSLDACFQHAPEADNLIYEMDLGEEESHIYGVATGKQTIRQICEMSYLSNFETCQCLWGFLCLGALVPVQAGDNLQPTAPTGAVEGLEEIRHRFEKVFELVQSALEQIEPGASTTFLENAIRQVKDQHPGLFDSITSLDRLSASVVEAARAADDSAMAARIGRADSALQDLLFALLLMIKLRRGPEEERILSEAVTKILHPAE